MVYYIISNKNELYSFVISYFNSYQSK